MGICPISNEVCTFDEQLNELASEQLPDKVLGLERVREDVKEASHKGVCHDGVYVDELQGRTYCGNSKALTMSKVAISSARSRGLDASLFKRMHFVDKG